MTLLPASYFYFCLELGGAGYSTVQHYDCGSTDVVTRRGLLYVSARTVTSIPLSASVARSHVGWPHPAPTDGLYTLEGLKIQTVYGLIVPRGSF